VTPTPRIAGLGGGIGASRLWRVLADEVGQPNLTLVVNTADDLWLHGLRICPDIDTTLYALSGRQDGQRGWGIKGESFRCMTALAALGGDAWFSLGDLDLATHLYRTGLLRDGHGLATVTARLASAFGVTARLLPMTEDSVTTMIETAEGRWLHYEEYLVRDGGAATVRGVRFDGLDRARPAPGVLAALRSADIIVLAPSNPVASMRPILGLPGVTEALRDRREQVVGVSPIVSGVAITDPGERRRAASRAALLAAAGAPATAAGVARLYRDLCSRYAYDVCDRDEAERIRAEGIEPLPAELLLHAGASPASLLAAILRPPASG
jgi:LPPG:FO 2-phospho-L-lactate transferase